MFISVRCDGGRRRQFLAVIDVLRFTGFDINNYEARTILDVANFAAAGNVFGVADSVT